MSLNLEEENDDRFFTSASKEKITAGQDHSNLAIGSSDDEDVDSEGEGGQKCLTLRLLQKCLPCVRAKTIWEPSSGDVFKMQEVEEIKYPSILRVLEHPMFDVIFVATSILSVFLLLFSEGFILENRILWGVIHGNNTIYTFCVFSMWLQILVKSKYARTNQTYSTKDVIFSLLSVLPVDIIVLVIYILNENNEVNPIAGWITISRLTYLFRIRNAFVYFSKWDDHLGLGDFKMFFLRTLLYGFILIHLISCALHRIACVQFTMGHFLMMPEQATDEVCAQDSWVGRLIHDQPLSPLFRHKTWNVLLEHYFVCVYWSIVTLFRLGSSDITPSLITDVEIAFTSVTEIMSWIFLIVYVSGSLTSLLVEMDTEKQNFFTRRFAIDKYLDFSYVTQEIRNNVNIFYDYLWARSRGIHNWDLVEQMPVTMKAEIYYDVNKFVLDQLPLFANLEEAFLMNVSVHMKHSFYLRGEVLQRKNDAGSAMFYLINGHLEILDDGENVIAEIRSGSAIGEVYLLQSYPNVSTVRCGTECDIMVLRKDDFKKVLSMYPEYTATLLKRLDNRLEQSGLLLALCEKYNQYPAAFRHLHEIYNGHSFRQSSDSYYRHSYEMVTCVLDTTNSDDTPKDIRKSDDYDDVVLKPGMQKQLNRTSVCKREKRVSPQEAVAAACIAVEADVTRAASLAKDLNIPRPPLSVTAPSAYQLVKAAKVEKRPLAAFIIPTISEKSDTKSDMFIMWKIIVLTSAFTVFWYYPYQFAFSNHAISYFEYFAHIFDLIFAVDFIVDTLHVIILPQKTLESPKEILAYRAKTGYFYIRLFSFLPIEYVVGPMIGVNRTDKPISFFFLLKFNRLIQYYEGMKFFSLFDANSKVPPELLFLVRFTLRLFCSIHVLAVIFEVLLKLVELKDYDQIPELKKQEIRFYEFVFYWAIEVVTATGYGDFPLQSDYEILITVLGLILGASGIIYLNARVSAMMVNRNRRRVTFKQTFYCLIDFMKERKFPKTLFHRVRKYYQLQWRAHEGVLIPHEKSAIWDAPKTLFQSVSVAQAQKFVSRIPLFRYCPEVVIMDLCTALRQYIVPPHEVILYPGDQCRELYIIVKGFCRVHEDEQIVGTLSEGNYFGLQGLVYGTNKNIRIETVNYCQFFCLEFVSFVTIAQKFPKLLFEYKILRGDTNFPKTFDPHLNPVDYEILKPKDPPPVSTGSQTSNDPQITSSGPQIASGSDKVPTDSTAREEKPKENNEEAIEISPDLSNSPETLPQEPIKKKKINIFSKFLTTSIIPHGQFLKWWTLFRVICAFIIGNFAPIQSAFSVSPGVSLFVFLFFDVIAWFDMILCLRIGYFGSAHQLITHPKKTAMHYIKGPFLLDLLGCFPIDYFIILFYPNIIPFGPNMDYRNHYHLISIVRLNRMLQCYRLFTSEKILRKYIFRSLSFLILLEVVPLLFLFLNFLTCIAVWLVCGPSLNGESIECDKSAWILNGIMFGSDRVAESTVLDDPFKSYLIGIYWVTVSALCVGFGDIDVVKDARNRQIAITVIFLGTVTTGYLVSKLTACSVGEDSRRIEIREKTKIMFRYLEQFDVPKDLRRRVKEFYFSAWDKTKGIYPKDLFYALPPTLKSDAMKELYEERLRTSPVFQKVDQEGIRILAYKLKEMFYPEGEFLFEYGDLNADVFFLAKGIVVSYTERGDVITYMGFGSVVGEVSCLFEVQRLYTAVAATDAEIYIFNKEDFLDFLNLYPDVKQTLEEGCLRHYKETMEAAVKSTALKVIIPITDVGTDEEQQIIEDKKGWISPGEETSDQEISKKNFNEEIGAKITKQEALKIANESHQNLLEMSLQEVGTIKQLSKSERENVPDFIEDPLRLPVQNDPTKDAERKTREDYSHHWMAMFITYGRVPRDEMGILHIVQEKGKFSWYNAVVHPLSPICSWVSMMLFLTSLSCGMTAYEIAFSTNAEGETINLMTLRCSLEIFFVVRIIGNFHLGYYDESGVMISNIRKISKRYLFRPFGFVLDLLTTFPFYLISYILGDLKDGTLSADIRSLQLLRVFLFARYLKETETELRMKASLVKIVKVTILLCFIFHFCACAWYLVACDGLKCSEGSWMSIFLKDLLDNKKIKKTAEISIASRYLLSLYYVTTAITFTGLSDITPRTSIELVCTIAMIFTTVFVIGFLVGEMTQCLAAQVASKIHFRHKLTVMEHHFHSLGLSQPKINDVRQYFRLFWLRCNGKAYTKLLSELPYPLLADIAMKVYGPNIKNSRILGALDDTIIRQLSARVKHEIYMPGAHIIRTGDVCISVFFIKRGEVVILDENANLELCVDVLYEGECFGEVKVLLCREQFRFSYVARLESEIGVLFREDLEEVLGRHQGLFDEMVEKADRVKGQRLAMKGEEDEIGLRTLGVSGSSVNIAPSEDKA